MVFQPVQRIADQEVAHLVAREVVDRGVPVLVEAFARVGVVVQRGAVKVVQAMRVGREMRRHPVQDHAQVMRMAGGDEFGEAFRRAEARGRRVHAQWLVAPGTVKRVLGDGQQFQVREAHILRVGRQGLGQFLPAQPAAVIMPAPAAQVHFVDRHRCLAVVEGLALFRQRHLRRHAGYHAGGGRSHLGGEGKGVGLQRQQMAGAVQQFEFVMVAACGVGHKDFPQAGTWMKAHGMAPAVPGVEVADHADAARIRRPDHEAHTVHITQAHRVRALHGVRPQM